ncbi:hypothetical protein ABZV58_24450 [Nocardia sp. NPDC004654]|uniref:TolB family protein n=1 Tax=Nocardia sp. NPDC004654 TaxID=3154776 RepID=UPI0033B40DD8
MDPDGGNVVELATGGNGPTFSPDGTKILYTRNPAPETGAEIWVTNADGTAAQRISDPGQTARHPSWGGGGAAS